MGLKLSRAPGDKADRDSVTCMSVVKVGMDGARSTFKQLPLSARLIGSASHSCGGRLTSLSKGTVSLKRPREDFWEPAGVFIQKSVMRR